MHDAFVALAPGSLTGHRAGWRYATAAACLRGPRPACHRRQSLLLVVAGLAAVLVGALVLGAIARGVGAKGGRQRAADLGALAAARAMHEAYPRLFEPAPARRSSQPAPPGAARLPGARAGGRAQHGPRQRRAGDRGGIPRRRHDRAGARPGHGLRPRARGCGRPPRGSGPGARRGRAGPAVRAARRGRGRRLPRPARPPPGQAHAPRRRSRVRPPGGGRAPGRDRSHRGQRLPHRRRAGRAVRGAPRPQVGRAARSVAAPAGDRARPRPGVGLRLAGAPTPSASTSSSATPGSRGTSGSR